MRRWSIIAVALVALYNAGNTVSSSAANIATLAIPPAMQLAKPVDANIVHVAHRKHYFKHKGAHHNYRRHHGRRHGGSGFYFGWGYPYYYDPYYYDPYYYNPGFYSPYYKSRIGCADAGRLLRRRGYRNVRAYDCSGSTYGFYATKGNTRFRISVSAWNGRIVKRKSL